MIHDLDTTISRILKRELPGLFADQVAISFDAPDEEFTKHVTFPAVNLFLYDVRENLELRDVQWVLERHDNGKTTRRRPPVRIDCSYLITAWPGQHETRSAEEHQLLSDIMIALLRYPTIPEAFLERSLVGQQPPLPTSTLQPGRLQSLAEFWQAMGGKPKAALNYTVTIGINVEPERDTEPAVFEKVLDFEPEPRV